MVVWLAIRFFESGGLMHLNEGVAAWRGKPLPDRWKSWTMLELDNMLVMQSQCVPCSAEMICISGGASCMSPDKHYPEEAPSHRIVVEGFSIDHMPVTDREVRKFANATGYIKGSDWFNSAARGPCREALLNSGKPARRRRELRPRLPRTKIPRNDLKGGSHLYAPNSCRRCRPATRHPQQVDNAISYVGFRCVARQAMPSR